MGSLLVDRGGLIALPDFFIYNIPNIGLYLI